MNPLIPTIITLAAVIIITISYSLLSARTAKQFRARLDQQFGKDPDDKEIKMESVTSYWYEKLYNNDAHHYIDDTTWNDLDMDSVFAQIDTCQTSVGEECLFTALHEPVTTEDQLLRREALISRLDVDPELRLDLQMILSKVGKSDHSGLASFCYDITSKKLNNLFLYKVLAFLPLIFVALLFANLMAGILGILAALVANAIIYYRVTIRITQETAAIKYFSILVWGARQICTRLPGSEYPAIKELDAAYKVFKKLGGKLSSVGQQHLSEMESIIEYFQIASLSSIRSYNKMIEEIEEHAAEFKSLYENMGEIDMAIAVLAYRKRLPFFTRPNFQSGSEDEDGNGNDDRADNKLLARELYHPLVAKPMCNTVSITKNSLVSGSNASGKSTFIKAIAVNAILAQTINTCTAKAFQMRFSLVISSMAIRDDITSGDSYFISEIKSLKRIIDKIGETNCICIIDEILRGTNTVERIAASTAVLRHLSELDCLCIVATHDIELTSLLSGLYHNYHFSEQVTSEGVLFDYTIKEGPTKTKNAITLLDHLGFDKQIIESANNQVKTFEETGHWA